MSEYKPTEYVVDFGDYRSNQFVRLNMALIEQNGAKLQERIVRCRDCVHYDPHPTDDGVCFLPDGDGDFARWEVEPDGFCKWSERRTDE